MQARYKTTRQALDSALQEENRLRVACDSLSTLLKTAQDNAATAAAEHAAAREQLSQQLEDVSGRLQRTTRELELARVTAARVPELEAASARMEEVARVANLEKLRAQNATLVANKAKTAAEEKTAEATQTTMEARRQVALLRAEVAEETRKATEAGARARELLRQLDESRAREQELRTRIEGEEARAAAAEARAATGEARAEVAEAKAKATEARLRAVEMTRPMSMEASGSFGGISDAVESLSSSPSLSPLASRPASRPLSSTPSRLAASHPSG